MLNFLRIGSFSDERAHDERAECRREAKVRCEHDHAEAETDGHDDERFVVHKFFRPFEKAGDEVHTEYEPEHEEEDEPSDAEQKF